MYAIKRYCMRYRYDAISHAMLCHLNTAFVNLKSDSECRWTRNLNSQKQFSLCKKYSKIMQFRQKLSKHCTKLCNSKITHIMYKLRKNYAILRILRKSYARTIQKLYRNYAKFMKKIRKNQ